jgi:hypothetical protein
VSIAESVLQDQQDLLAGHNAAPHANANDPKSIHHIMSDRFGPISYLHEDR